MTEYHDIFLSHSSKDTGFLRQLVNEWRSWSFDVFADFEDKILCAKSEQESVDAEVAEHLRQAIRRCDLFVFVASENSVDSHWMPWELGLAHGTVGRVHLYFPDTANRAAFKDHEYLQLYNAHAFDASTAREHLRNAVQEARSEAITRAAEEQSRYMGRLLGDATMAQDWQALLKQLGAFGAHAQATQAGAGERIGQHSSLDPQTSHNPLPFLWIWPWR